MRLSPVLARGQIGNGAGCGSFPVAEERFIALLSRALRMGKSTSTDTWRRQDLEQGSEI